MSTGAIDLNATLHDGGAAVTTGVENEELAARSGPQTPAAAEATAPRHHRLDDNELSGFGRLAAEPRTQTSQSRARTTPCCGSRRTSAPSGRPW